MALVSMAEPPIKVAGKDSGLRPAFQRLASRYWKRALLDPDEDGNIAGMIEHATARRQPRVQSIAPGGMRAYHLLMAVTIELTDDQVQALSQPHPNPPQLINPHTREAFVLLRIDQYKKLTEDVYDDSPLTREELEASAWQAAERGGWDGDDSDAGETR